ncbi:uncharacterized protein LOC117648226 [Thrips palmi]|uniref:Uncharacterized protein LOC117648226 n=1 Tax=Thrips palmi TaxID=161013 RepID=A0A6P8ZCL8_THRPL|nr:uncharacterized protein LOC117648226 [Thrips palmi]
MRQFVMLLLLLVAYGVNVSDGVSRPKFPDCSETKFPSPENVLPGGSCIIQRWGWDKQNDGTFRNIDCENLRLNETLDGKVVPKNSQNLVEVKLGVFQYLHNHRSYPNPTISFSKINCTDVMVKLSVVDSNITSCIKFNFSTSDPKLMEKADFLYDCRWLPHQYENNVIEAPMTIEYQASNKISAEYKKYYFRLPQNGTADREETGFRDFQLLVYREQQTDSPCVSFYWSRPPEKFNVSKYKVNLHNKNDNVTKPDSFFVDDPKTSICSLPDVNTSYFISVEPCICSEGNCTCGAASVSETFCTNVSNIHFTIVLLVALIILIIILLLLWCWYLIKLYVSTRTTRFQNCILVFEPSCKSHVTVVTKLVEFLRSLRVPVLYGETDIGDQNSTDWYSENLSNADLVLIVSNPKPKNEIDFMTASTSYPVYTRGCVKSFLRDIIHTQKKFIRILLPYCDVHEFYDFTRTKEFYHLEKEPHRLLKEILGPYIWIPRILSRVLFAPYLQTEEWKNLKLAIKEAKKFINASEATAPLKNEYEVEYDQSCNTFSSTISDDEGAPDVELRNQKLQKYIDEESSGSESEFQLHKDFEEESHKSLDGMLDAQLFYDHEISTSLTNP